MRRFNSWAVGLLAMAVLIGCGPGKEVPDVVPGAKGPSGALPDPLAPVPAASDTAAKAVLERAVKAITENVPGGRETGKVARAVYKGEMQLSQGTEMTKTDRTIDAIWPDQVLWVNTFKDARLETASATVSFYLRGNRGWMKQGLQVEQADSADIGQIIRTDMTAQYWLMLGLTLAQPETVAFELVKTDDTSTVKIGLPNMPVLRVTFEEKTGLPVQVEYYPPEQQQRPHKVYKMSEHKPAGGLMLPTRVELQQNSRLAERFTLVSWEFPKEIDLTRFSPPK